LALALGQAGFIDVTQFKSKESNDPEFKNFERHGHTIGNEELNAYETLVLEASKGN